MKTFADINTSNITTYILMSQRLQLYNKNGWEYRPSNSIISAGL